MKISIFEKYIPLHRLQRNNAAKRHGRNDAIIPTLISTRVFGSQSDYPNMCLQF